ncbi:MAG: DUF1972 domain-containing protein [Propioniciclava sp.]|uniref:DUF1972 domain-containing protein n=1 Tax=Propioniciclava sp. TaxID=2038686 RepID=UPI0039E3A8E5
MSRALSIAMVGTRGAPARYGGFETAIEEIGTRLVERGHDIRVYCRTGNSEVTDSYRGMKLVTLPALRHRALETLSHTGLSALHLATHRTDAAFLFNAANAPFLPVIRAARIPVATHVDGLEWKRAKWGPKGQAYYRGAETASVWMSDALIADAQGIADYYQEEFGVPTELITYGAPILTDVASDKLAEAGLSPDGFHLVVARFEPENHVDMIVEGYLRSSATRPLVVVGSAPYADWYVAKVRSLAEGDPRVRFFGGVWDQDLLDQMYAHCLSYLHGHSVGGTNPSLLRAIGAGAATTAFDVAFNREVVGADGLFFGDPADVAKAVERAEADVDDQLSRGERLQERARAYDWDHVADGYEDLARRLVAGEVSGPWWGTRRRRPGRGENG